MNLKEFADHVNAYLQMSPRNADKEVAIVIKEEDISGPMPHVGVRSVQIGIDWDSEMFMIWPDKDLEKIK